MTEVVDVAQVVRLAPRSNPHEWMDRGLCRGRTELFFAPFGEQAEARLRREAIARAICTSCEVLTTCRDYAREHREQGFWGGENDDERTLARRRRRLATPGHLARTAAEA